MATGMVGWGQALGSAYGSVMQGSTVNVTTSSTDGLLCLGDYAQYNPQQYTNSIAWNNGLQMLQQAQQSIQKPIEKAKSILQSLRDEMHGWCSNVLEVA